MLQLIALSLLHKRVSTAERVDSIYLGRVTFSILTQVPISQHVAFMIISSALAFTNGKYMNTLLNALVETITL